MSHNSRAFTNYLITNNNSKHFLKGNNIITTRPNNIYASLPQISCSETLGEAAMKSRRFFKRVCRMVI